MSNNNTLGRFVVRKHTSRPQHSKKPTGLDPGQHVSKKQRLETQRDPDVATPDPRDLLDAAREKFTTKVVQEPQGENLITTRIKLKTQPPDSKADIHSSPEVFENKDNDVITLPPSTGLFTPQKVRERPRSILTSTSKPPPKLSFQTPRRTILTIDSLPPPVKFTSLRTLRLPSFYQILYDMFTSLEQTIMFLRGQDQPCLFAKIKRSVENGCKRTFTEQHLSQIITIYPEAYNVSTTRCQHEGVSLWTYSIEAVLDDAGSSSSMSSSISSLSKLSERKQIFYDRLEKRVIACHEEFLISKGILSTSNDSALMQWHPCFNLNSVPPIPPSKLPEYPLTSASILPSSPKKPQRLTSTLITTTPPSSPQFLRMPMSHSSPTPCDQLSRTPPKMSLLERIRAKEQKNSLEIMYGLKMDPERLKRQRALSKLPDIIDILHSLFSSGFTRTIVPAKSISEVTSKIARSAKAPLSEQEIMFALNVLVEICPDWAEIITLKPSGKQLIKLLKNRPSLSCVKAHMHKEFSKCKLTS